MRSPASKTVMRLPCVCVACAGPDGLARQTANESEWEMWEGGGQGYIIYAGGWSPSRLEHWMSVVRSAQNSTDKLSTGPHNTENNTTGFRHTCTKSQQHKHEALMLQLFRLWHGRGARARSRPDRPLFVKCCHRWKGQSVDRPSINIEVLKNPKQFHNRQKQDVKFFVFVLIN